MYVYMSVYINIYIHNKQIYIYIYIYKQTFTYIINKLPSQMCLTRLRLVFLVDNLQ